MIVVTIEHAPSLALEYDTLGELADACEAIVGLVFAEEQDHVDVRVRYFGAHDRYEEPLFITVDVEDEELIHDPQSLAYQFIVHFGTHLDAYTSQHVPFRLWVRRITGSYVESGPIKRQETDR